jgi:hypothetical protein
MRFAIVEHIGAPHISDFSRRPARIYAASVSMIAAMANGKISKKRLKRPNSGARKGPKKNEEIGSEERKKAFDQLLSDAIFGVKPK